MLRWRDRPRVIVMGWGLGVLALAGTAGAQSQPDPGQRTRVAVLDLSGSALRMQATSAPLPGQPYPPSSGSQTTVTVAIPPPAEFARGLTEMLTTILVGTQRFVVLERAALAQLDQEQGLGAERTTRETAARIGALLGAQALITGDITGFTFGRSTVGGTATNLVRGLGVAAERVSAEVTVDLRIIDATSGEVLASAAGRGSASQTGVAADLVRENRQLGSEASLTTPLGKASRQALTEGVAALLRQMPVLRWGAPVIDVRAGVVYVAAAAADGMRPGLELEIYAIGEPLIDPGTGALLGAPERLVGVIRIAEVLERFSAASVVRGEGITRGQVARLARSPPP